MTKKDRTTSTIFKRYFRGLDAVAPELRKLTSDEILARNMTRTRIMLFVILTAELIELVYSLLLADFSRVGSFYFVGICALLTVSSVYSIILYFAVRNNSSGMTCAVLTYSCWLCVVICSLVASYAQIVEGKTIITAAAFGLIIGVVPILSALRALPALTIYAAVNIAFIYINDAPSYMMRGIIISYIISAGVSAVQYISTMDEINEYIMLDSKNHKLVEISEKDPLTGIYNRRGFQNAIDRYGAYGMQYAVYMIDIDNFKNYNDQYFHEAGDNCLKKIATALSRSTFRKEDVVARYGGEEFVVYAYGIEKRDVISVAERIQNEISQLEIVFDNNGGKKYVTVSIGAAFSPENGKMTVQNMIGAADIELYNAKGNGKDCISFNGEIFRTTPAKVSQMLKNGMASLIGESTVHHGKKTVLIVDDQPLNCEMLSMILSTDYSVLTATNGVEALDMLTKRNMHISAVMLDIVMPEMDGFEFLNRIREFDILRNIPIIVTTGNNEKASEKKSLMYGAWDFVSKPYDAAIIKFRLKNAIDRSQLPAFNQLKYLAEFDALTGIYNKNRFFEATREMLGIGNSDNYVFIRFDINRFQLINAFFGIAEGDRILKYLAHSTSEYGRYLPEYSYGRIEADTFAVCIPYEDEDSVLGFVDYIKDELKRYQIEFDIVPAFGAYVITNRSMTIDSMLDKANLASKKIKGDYVSGYAFYTDDMGRSLEIEQELTNEMNEALESNQFVVYIQPKYNLQNETPCGGEALVRWMHPEKGMISPGVFIPVFERNGFIAKLDFYIWERVCALLGRWILEGKNPDPVSVNVSRVNLYNTEFVASLCNLTEKYNVPNSLLNLEITESIYTDNSDIIDEKISQLRERGFVIMMDDFGSGYSSLNILKDIDVDVLKIDMKFLSGSEDSDRGGTIIESVVEMAKKLKIGTVAEGVERKEQTEFLASVGCDFVQGYYYARPMPAEDYEQKVVYSRAVN